jgi:hypothetical protein
MEIGTSRTILRRSLELRSTLASLGEGFGGPGKSVGLGAGGAARCHI